MHEFVPLPLTRYCSAFELDTLPSMEQFFAPQDELRQQIAAIAAKMIAEEGYDYSSARQKAIKQVAGTGRLLRELQPNDQEIEAEVRSYQSLFQSSTQPAELLTLRKEACELMKLLADFNPILFGSSVNGTGNRLSDIHILAFADDPKEVDYWLLNRDIQFDPCEDAILSGKQFPAVGFKWRTHWVQLGSATDRERRGLLKKNQKTDFPFQTDLTGLLKLLEQQEE